MIHLGNNLDVMQTIGAGSMDLIITSPPYKDVDDYQTAVTPAVFSLCYKVLKENSLFFLNFGHLAEDKFRPFSTCKMAMDCGFKLNDTITWVKNHYKPIQGERRLNNLSEFIFVLYKGEMPKLNRLAVGIPYVDKTNAKRFNGGKDLHCAGNVWYIDYPTINSSEQKPHADRFPVELPERCIKLCGYPVMNVLDPYCGSGTVGVACQKLHKTFTGIEINPVHVDRAMEILAAV